MKKQLKEYIAELTKFMEEQGCQVSPYPSVVFKNDVTESQGLFGKTGYYDAQQKAIVLYIYGRHPKDIMRSYAHELIHHDQNMRGLFNNPKAMSDDPAYAQNNPYLRKMEMDANLRGNMLFRDWTDNKKYSK